MANKKEKHEEQREERREERQERREERREERECFERCIEIKDELRAVVVELKGIKKAVQCVCEQLTEFNEFVRFPKAILISQQGETKNMGVINGVVVGNTGELTATGLPAGTSFGTVVPTWSNSDETNSTLTPSADGLSAALAVGAGAPVGGSTVVNVSATSPDGTITATGTATVPYLPTVTPPQNFPTSIDINQTS
jgi:uncharacterized membrane protein